MTEDKKKESQEIDNISDSALSSPAGIIGAFIPIIILSVIFPLAFNTPPTKNNNKATPNAAEAQKRLLSVFKDPAMVEGLIEQLKNTPVNQEILNDPEIMKNIKKLEDAVLGSKGSIEQRMKQLREKKELLDDINPGNWADKAIQGKGDPNSIPKRGN